MAKTQELLYAVVGAGDFTVEKVRNARKVADRKTGQKLYKDFVKRGKTLSTKVRNSAPTKQALAQTKNARAQVKAATTSVSKLLRATASGSTQQAAEQTKIARAQVNGAATSVTMAAKAGAKATRSAAEKVAHA